MSLTKILLLIGFAGLVAALWVQARGFGLPQADYRRRQKKVALALAALLFALGAAAAAHESGVVRVKDGHLAVRLTAPEVDGAWAAVSIDGRPVPWREWRIGVTDGKVSGGRDGCNDWDFDEPEVEGGERTIVSTLVGCPEEDPVRKAYWALATAPDPSLQLRGDGTLRIAGRGHEAVLRRCRWITEPLPPGTSGTGNRVCALQ
ncbi:MAG TPA: hypothetical protein VGB59_12975 [Allosphingosinicella sp.]|jgi:hypothetical protein